MKNKSQPRPFKKNTCVKNAKISLPHPLFTVGLGCCRTKCVKVGFCCNLRKKPPTRPIYTGGPRNSKIKFMFVLSTTQFYSLGQKSSPSERIIISTGKWCVASRCSPDLSLPWRICSGFARTRSDFRAVSCDTCIPQVPSSLSLKVKKQHISLWHWALVKDMTTNICCFKSWKGNNKPTGQV